MNMNKGQLLGDFQLGDQDCRDLGPCICSECSGKNDDGVRVWKVTNSLYELKMHSYTVHNGIISEGTLINYEKNDDEDVFIKSSNEYFMMRRNDIEEKYRDKFGDEPTIEEPSTIKVYGWNSVSACTPENKVLINAFLEQNRADILMLNECGPIKDKKIIKNKNYKVLSQGEGAAIVYNEKYTVTQIVKFSYDHLIEVLKHVDNYSDKKFSQKLRFLRRKYKLNKEQEGKKDCQLASDLYQTISKIDMLNLKDVSYKITISTTQLIKVFKCLNQFSMKLKIKNFFFLLFLDNLILNL